MRLAFVLVLATLPLKASGQPSAPEWVTTPYIEAKISLTRPGFDGLSVDSLGRRRFSLVPMKPLSASTRPMKATRRDGRVEYRDAASKNPRWSIEVKTKDIVLQSHWTEDDPPEPLQLEADSDVCHLTLLGLMETNGSIRLPAILHFPGQGSFRISAGGNCAEPLAYATTRKDVRITFPAATRKHPTVIYRLETVCIYPNSAGIGADPRFDAVRRDWLNIFQINPQRRMLSNNAGSDSCGFCYYEYADIAEQTPPLANGLTALDLVRQTLDRIFGGEKACGMPGYTRGREDRPEPSADTLPSFLIAAEDYVDGSHDKRWLFANYGRLQSWAAQMLATDRTGDGLIKYILSGNSGSWPEKIKYRPANWWDTIGFGYEDAYANALAYRALLGMTRLSQESDHADDVNSFRAAANKLKAAYFNTFYDPATGVLAGWKSADGQLHDYYFPWVNGIAVDYALVPQDNANDIMNRLLAKMKEARYTNFSLGLPGNLIPVPRKDYVDHHHSAGGGTKEDGSDGFQIYENGGATACFAYFTIAALYDLGRCDEADAMLFPMLKEFDAGRFERRNAQGRSSDWRKWDGTPTGYEGLLGDNYYTLLAVLDRESAIKKAKRHLPFFGHGGER